jgi:hypothetical protein
MEAISVEEQYEKFAVEKTGGHLLLGTDPEASCSKSKSIA